MRQSIRNAGGVEQDRAVSEVVGYVLMVAVILVGVSITATVGVDRLEAAQLSQNTQSVERGMDLVEASLDELQHGQSTVRSSALSLASGDLFVNASDAPSTITVNVSGVNAGSTTYPLGRLTYRMEGASIAYEGGGLFLQSGGGDPIEVGTPTIRCEEGTAIVSIVTLRGHALGRSFGGADASIVVRTNESLVRFPSNRSGPGSLGDATGVNVSVDSPYDAAWGDSLEDRGWTETTPGTYRCEPNGGDVYVRQTIVDVRVRR